MVVFDLKKNCSDKLEVEELLHEYGDDDVNAALVIGADNSSATANEAPKIFAIDHFEVVHLDDVVEIDVRIGKGTGEGRRWRVASGIPDRFRYSDDGVIFG